MSATGRGGFGVVGLGDSGSPTTTRKAPELCVEHGHPPVTFNPWLNTTWCLCGSKVRRGSRVSHAACCGGPLEVSIEAAS